MSTGQNARSIQVAKGNGNAQALGPGATATVNIIESAKLELTDETARLLLANQFDLELRPEIGELFKIVSQPAGISKELYSNSEPNGPAPFDIPYVSGRKGFSDVQKSLASELNKAGAILILGRTGLGKTREIGELLHDFTLNGWTAYIYNAGRSRLQLPKNVHTVGSQKVILVFDNAHEFATTPDELQQWLDKIIATFRGPLLPSDLRIVVSSKSEPQHLSKLGVQSESDSWKRFSVFQLAEFTSESLESILRWLIAHDHLKVASESHSEMMSDSDGTPAMLVEKVKATRLSHRPLRLDSWREMRLRDWSERFPMVYQQSRATIPILKSLLLLHRADLPLNCDDACTLAHRLGASHVGAGLALLIDNRVIGRSLDTLLIFGLSQLVKGLQSIGQPVPALKDFWPLLVDTLNARTDKSAIGRDLLRLAEAAALDGELGPAIEIATRAVEHPDVRPRALFLRGLFQLIRPDIVRGRQDIAAALANGLDAPEAYFILGLAEFVSGDYALAETHFTIAISNRGVNSAFWLGRALARYSQRKLDGAAADLDKAIEAGTPNPSTFLLRGSILLLKEDHLAAARDFDEVIQLGRQDSLVYLLRGIARRSYDLSGAEGDFTCATEHPNPGPKAYLLRGTVRAAQGNSSGAEADFTIAIEKGGSSPDLLLARGMARLNLKNYTGAEDDFTRAINVDKAVPQYYSLRAAARVGKREWASAEEDLNRAIEVGAETVDAFRTRAELRWRMHRPTEAQEDLRRAATLDGKT